jgi:hypothetical protein
MSTMSEGFVYRHERAQDGEPPAAATGRPDRGPVE